MIDSALERRAMANRCLICPSARSRDLWPRVRKRLSGFSGRNGQKPELGGLLAGWDLLKTA